MSKKLSCKGYCVSLGLIWDVILCIIPTVECVLPDEDEGAVTDSVNRHSRAHEFSLLYVTYLGSGFAVPTYLISVQCLLAQYVQ